ncbi:hypothetical protein ACTGJ9_029765 [Bradyrhizobium sp. RDM12]
MTLGSPRWLVVTARGDVEAAGGKFQFELSDPLEDASSDRLGLLCG